MPATVVGLSSFPECVTISYEWVSRHKGSRQAFTGRKVARGRGWGEGGNGGRGDGANYGQLVAKSTVYVHPKSDNATLFD